MLKVNENLFQYTKIYIKLILNTLDKSFGNLLHRNESCFIINSETVKCHEQKQWKSLV